MYALFGAAMVGWGVTIAALARFGVARRQRWAWWTLVASLLSWFVLDAGCSLHYGVGLNEAISTGLLVLIGIPLWFTRKAFD